MESWVEWEMAAEPLAYGVLGLGPLDFGNITPHEFIQTYKGYMWKRERELRDNTGLVAAIINYCGQIKKGHAVRSEQLIKFQAQDPKNPFYMDFIGILPKKVRRRK